MAERHRLLDLAADLDGPGPHLQGVGGGGGVALAGAELVVVVVARHVLLGRRLGVDAEGGVAGRVERLDDVVGRRAAPGSAPAAPSAAAPATICRRFSQTSFGVISEGLIVGSR